MRQPVTTIDIRRDLVGLLPRLRRFAMTLTGDVAAADELVQSVCQRAVAKSQQWNGERRLESWVYTLARHLWNDEGRKRRPRPAAPKGNVTDIHEAARERATVTDTDLVHRMLAEMPENLASIFLLTVVEGHSYEQTAEIMGIPAIGVSAQLAAARLHFASLADDFHHRY
ncbi:RNA polymerase sigma factor [Rhizobium sp. BE258]|jgi:RNA polymerase sigma-70 factor (ECF subfamily)|uniref:RNA polymerase sigma factor n=1 Tax=Rhizobium sp. BE258 TaxID=2817722 RepID=UPI00285BFB48|nr:RNA polymerase sigma factor [Rhizobium sp. BE258]MDR7144288.1 RNA polymerase sigma-70 factor (ECF subfamily) [Rhizobium sp. BE258]